MRNVVAYSIVAALIASSFEASGSDCSAEERRTISKLPRSEAEIAAAFAAAAGQACRPVAAGRSLEVRSLSPVTSADVGLRSGFVVGNRTLPIPMARRPVVSVGLTIAPEDAAGLPFLSSSIIQSYLYDHYVSLQVLVRRDLDTGSLCLHDTAAAACLPCRGSQLTEEFEPLVRRSLQDTRCLGLYLPPGEPISAAVPGMLVFVVCNPMYDAAVTPAKVKPSYELFFVRAKSVVSATGEEDLELHSFMTGDGRTKLHHLPSFELPGGNASCNVTGAVVFTKYAADGLTPVESALRSLVVRGRSTLTEAELNRLLPTENAASHWLDQPVEALDAVIAVAKTAK